MTVCSSWLGTIYSLSVRQYSPVIG
jgi:hypothetical protein